MLVTVQTERRTPYHVERKLHRPEELLAEVHRRTMADIGDYRGPKQRQPVTLDNIINLDDIKRIRFDEDRLRAVLEGEEAA